MTFIIPIKPLSVNEAWKGKRFKTDAYKHYERSILFILPKGKVSEDSKLSVNIEFGFSSSGSDIDNPVKCLMDIFQKKYGFNDSHVYEINLKKVIVKKGKEYSKIEIKSIELNGL